MDTLITGEKKPRSGLYTLQFSYMPLSTTDGTVIPTSSNAATADSPTAVAATAAATATSKKKKNVAAANNTKSGVIDMSPPSEDDDLVSTPTGDAPTTGTVDGLNIDRAGANAEDDDDGRSGAVLSAKDEAEEDPSVKEARLNALNKACATEFGSWTLLCRLRFEGDVMGRIKGSVKVKSRYAASHATAAGSGGEASVGEGTTTAINNAEGDVTVAATATAISTTASGSQQQQPASSSPPTSPSSSPTAPTAAAASSSSPSSSSSGTRACIQPDSHWKPSDEVKLLISLDRLDGAVVGLPHDLTNVVLHCHSYVSDGWYVGAASVVLSNGSTLKLPRKLQFLLREYNGPRCSRCLDPIDHAPSSSSSSSSASSYYLSSRGNGSAGVPSLSPIITCGGCCCVQYCSVQCQEAHFEGHKGICHALKPFGTGAGTAVSSSSSPSAATGSGGDASQPAVVIPQLFTGGGRAVASYAGAEFFVYWRCVKGCTFELIADHNNPFGVAYELQLNPLKDAREGLDYAFLSPTTASSSSAKNTVAAEETSEAASASAFEEAAPAATQASTSTGRPNISPQELNELNISIFFAVAQNARDEGALLLTSACLNHLFTFCDCVDNLVLSYFQFYDVCVRDQFEGVRHISCLSEYVMYVRTTFELGQTLLEWALKAPFASLFWQRLVAAKDVLVSLYNFNASLQFAPPIQNVKAILVPDQQRQTLHLLAKIFVVMASRAPKDLAQRLLRRAEECYKDSIDEDKPRKNFREMGVTCLKLAALATLFESSDDKQKSKLFKDEGMELLKLATKAAETAARAREIANAAKTDAAAAAISNNIAVAAQQAKEQQQQQQQIKE